MAGHSSSIPSVFALAHLSCLSISFSYSKSNACVTASRLLLIIPLLFKSSRALAACPSIEQFILTEFSISFLLCEELARESIKYCDIACNMLGKLRYDKAIKMGV